MVIFDEATSSLDSESEQHILRAMNSLSRNHTSLVIAHRLSTVRRADVILILENGRVKESGSYQTLVQDPDSVFSSLLQTGLEEVLA